MTIIVPYRDREEHLSIFVPYMRLTTPGAKLVIVEQAASKPFNRGKLINVGFKETLPDYFKAHDVDMLPLKFNYCQRKGVTQLAKSNIQTHGYLGGVTMYDSETFQRVGGYHNEYFHRAEDNEMYFNLHRLKIPVHYRPATFRLLEHDRSGPEFIPELWEKAMQPRTLQDQLSVCKYEVVERRIQDDYLHLLVSI